jgi:hypothetical protein
MSCEPRDQPDASAAQPASPEWSLLRQGSLCHMFRKTEEEDRDECCIACSVYAGAFVSAGPWQNRVGSCIAATKMAPSR